MRRVLVALLTGAVATSGEETHPPSPLPPPPAPPSPLSGSDAVCVTLMPMYKGGRSPVASHKCLEGDDLGHMPSPEACGRAGAKREYSMVEFTPGPMPTINHCVGCTNTVPSSSTYPHARVYSVHPCGVVAPEEVGEERGEVPSSSSWSACVLDVVVPSFLALLCLVGACCCWYCSMHDEDEEEKWGVAVAEPFCNNDDQQHQEDGIDPPRPISPPATNPCSTPTGTSTCIRLYPYNHNEARAPPGGEAPLLLISLGTPPAEDSGEEFLSTIPQQTNNMPTRRGASEGKYDTLESRPCQGRAYIPWIPGL